MNVFKIQNSNTGLSSTFFMTTLYTSLNTFKLLQLEDFKISSDFMLIIWRILQFYLAW
eukprot:Pgem_evm1s3514